MDAPRFQRKTALDVLGVRVVLETARSTRVAGGAYLSAPPA